VRAEEHDALDLVAIDLVEGPPEANQDGIISLCC